MSTGLDTTQRGLLRQYFGIVMIAAASVLLLHALIGFLSGFGSQFGPYLMGLDALLLLMAYIGFELSSGTTEGKVQKPHYGLMVLVGIMSLLVCAETGGLASPFFLLILVTAVFAGLGIGLGMGVVRPASICWRTALRPSSTSTSIAMRAVGASISNWAESVSDMPDDALSRWATAPRSG